MLKPLNGSLQIRSLDEPVIRYWFYIFIATGKITGQESSTQVVIPVLKENDLVKIIAFSSLFFFRSMNNQWAHQPIRILRAIMRVIPICPVLVVNGKVVDEASSWRNGALRDPYSSIHPVGSILKHSVPMDACCVAEFIRDINQHLVAAVRSYQWTWKVAINHKNFPKDACNNQHRFKRRIDAIYRLAQHRPH